MAFSMHFLHGGVVGVFVRNEEGRFDITTVRILAFAVENLLVQFDVVVVDGIVEGDGDHLGHILGGEIPGYRGAILGAEAVRQDAHGGVAGGRPIGVVVDI